MRVHQTEVLRLEGVQGFDMRTRQPNSRGTACGGGLVVRHAMARAVFIGRRMGRAAFGPSTGRIQWPTQRSSDQCCLQGVAVWAMETAMAMSGWRGLDGMGSLGPHVGPCALSLPWSKPQAWSVGVAGLTGVMLQTRCAKGGHEDWGSAFFQVVVEFGQLREVGETNVFINK